jgi:branched-chain amino acid transport system substrate-binding protein
MPLPPPRCSAPQLILISAAALFFILFAAACRAPAPELTPAPSPTSQLAPTIEVTRIVTQEIVVTATPAPPVACAPASREEADVIVIGALAPLTQSGVWERGLAMQAGLAIAVETLNAAGGVNGKPVQLVTYDTGGHPERGALYAERLITQDCAIGLVGGFNDDVSRAVKAVTEQYGVPFLIIEASADDLTADQPRAVFRVAPTASMSAQMSARWLAEVDDFNADGNRTVVLIAENSPAGEVSVANATQWLPTTEFDLEVLRVDTPSTDYSPQIARIVAMEAEPDVVFLAVGADASVDLQRQLLDAGIGPRKGTLLVTGRSGLEGERFWQSIPDGEYTVIGRRGAWPSMLNPVGTGFVETYRRYAEQWPDPAAFGAFDAIYLLADAAARAPTLTPDDLVAALETADIELAAGRYRFPYGSQNPPDGATAPAYLWHQWTEPPLLYLQYSAPNQPPAEIDVIWPPAYRTTDGPVIKPG